MGITGLLPYLEAATRPCHISEFRGGSVAVDTYCFLHKGANAAAAELARGEDNKINLPAKAETEAKRRERRKTAKQRAAELLRLGKIEEAQNFLRQCIDITPKMAHNLIEACRELNVDCIVAPYESDAQLTFFDIKGVVDVVITEDSDLILFGCKKVMYKLDMSGAGRLVESDKIHLAMKIRPDEYTLEKFRLMCILSGCDYVDSLHGIGLKKAEKFMKLTAETNPELFLRKLPIYLKMKHLVITDEYKQKFMTANATFLHQTVFDPFKKSLTYLIHPQKTGTNPKYLVNCGEKFDNENAYQVAIGNMNPYSDEKYSDWQPLKVSTCSIWSQAFKKRISLKAEKELRQEQFKGFFKSEKTIKSAPSGVLEQQKALEDLRIEQELSIYFSNKSECKENLEKELSEEVETNKDREKPPDSKFSPVLAKNPFLKKKLSKFPRTYSDSTIVVKSRFFSNEIDIDTKVTSNDVIKFENNSSQSAIENETDNDIIEPTGFPVVTEEESKKRSFQDLSITNSQTDSVEEIVNSTMTVSSQQDKKRKLLEPCKQVGLSRKKSGGSAQKTLHNFFTKIMKKEND